MEPRFVIGEWVWVSAHVVSKHKESPREKYAYRVEYPEPRLGKIVGMKRMFWGVVKGLVKYYDEEYAPDVSYLTTTSSEKLWEVRFGYLNKAVYVRELDVEEVGFTDMPCKFPMLYQDWSPQMREDLSRIMKDVVMDLKRDAKGRFAPVFPNAKRRLASYGAEIVAQATTEIK
jgi:hypothetical protein